jgi:hypothetical protein
MQKPRFAAGALRAVCGRRTIFRIAPSANASKSSAAAAILGSPPCGIRASVTRSLHARGASLARHSLMLGKLHAIIISSEAPHEQYQPRK